MEEVNSTDHDLLIKLSTEMQHVKEVLTTLNANISTKTDDALIKVAALEKEKIDKAAAHEAFDCAKLVTDKLESRIRWLERIAYSGIAIGIALEFYFRYINVH